MSKFPQSVGGQNLSASDVPKDWNRAYVHQECSLHQLSPYIGKLKSKIAAELVSRYSEVGGWVVDPFSGSGTIPLEALNAGRNAFAADISPYARVLSQAKLNPPENPESALKEARRLVKISESLPIPDLRKVPAWVRCFFHPDTLRDILRFAEVCRQPGKEFFFACFLGILHHQRPGFLSYPSSHLVPYLRDKKYPRESFPEMYAYRPILPRLSAKIIRAFKRIPLKTNGSFIFQQGAIQEISFPEEIDAIITSPPYMNALDYGRDNRLRLWFINPDAPITMDNDTTKRRQSFCDAVSYLAKITDRNLKRSGYCIFIVGEEFRRNFATHPSETVVEIMQKEAPSIRLKKILMDNIPDIRRARRECRGVKTEHFLIFRKRK
jgi:SAM-dependent methyltransferase